MSTTALPAQSSDFPAWYGEVVRRAGLAENSAVRGAMVIKPYGYAIWEAIQRELDDRIKATGHENFYFPLLVPVSVLGQESELVEGFAPEVAVVTEAGGKKLEEPLAVRPTSEALIWSTYARWVQSYRDLPLLYNQWANVVRWELRPRLFLRTSEFLWQEGHTAHETEKEAVTETLTILHDVYADTIENVLAIPVLRGRKSESERFPGAVDTYTLEALMRDGKALQAATSHYLGQGFARAFDVRYTGRGGSEQYPYGTSWGASTRLVGGVVMAHGEHGGSGIEFQMLNAVRSQAIEAVIQVASWMHDQAGGGGWQLPENVRSVLDRHLDPAHEATRTVAAVYGRHFNHLFELDPEWTASHFRDFFPVAPERAGHRDAAWRAFVSSTRFWHGSWEVLAPEYERAVGELDVERTAADADSLVDASGSLLGHLLGMYLRDCTDLEEGSLLTRFFDTTALPIRTRFLELVGMDVSNAEKINDEVRDQLQRLWEWRADTVLAGGNASELAPFAWWFGSGKFAARWSLEQLIRVLDAGGGVSSEYIVTQRLAELLHDEPGLVVRATALLVERAYTPHMVFGASDELRRILVVGLQSDDEAVVAEARATSAACTPSVTWSSASSSKPELTRRCQSRPRHVRSHRWIS